MNKVIHQEISPNFSEASIFNYEEYSDIIREIREDVFIKEQGVPREIEFDGLDQEALHAVISDGDIAIATGRMLKDGHIGRIAVKKQYRNKGYGKIIMECLMQEAGNMGLAEVWLSSQYYVKDFYEKLGFQAIGGIYQEADIDHIKMIKKL